LKLLDKKTILITPPFSVEEVYFETNLRKPLHSYVRINAPDWVNIVPVTQSGQIILIRQPRPGSMSYVLETPGGVIDKGEKDPTMAAARELEEETGYTSTHILPLASINPNPAIMTNKCHFFVALNCTIASNRTNFPDVDEEISIELVNPIEVDFLIRTGQINHALACLGLSLATKYTSLSKKNN
jgi:ADP-ribose pyrophosphatase